MYSDLMRGRTRTSAHAFYAAEIVLAARLHELDILYRDLKPDNVRSAGRQRQARGLMGAARDRGRRQIKGGWATDTRVEDGEEVPEQGAAHDHHRRHGYRALGASARARLASRPTGASARPAQPIEMLTAENPLRGQRAARSQPRPRALTNAARVHPPPPPPPMPPPQVSHPRWRRPRPPPRAGS